MRYHGRGMQTHHSEELLTQRRILAFWLPLAATWLMMSVEGPFLAAIIARLAEPKFNLAAYGVAFAFAIIIESPVIMIMSAVTALAEDGPNFRRMRRYTYVLNLVITVFQVVLLATPLFDWVARDLMNLPPEVERLTRVSLWILLPWPGAIGYRRLYQGLLIRSGMTRRVAYGTVVRLLSMTASAFVLYSTGTLPGAWVGAGALTAGVCMEAVASRFMAHSALKDLIEPPTSERTLSYREIGRFYAPLAMTSTISLAAYPVVTFFMGHAEHSLESLAVLPVVNSLSFIFRSPALAYHDAVIALIRRSRTTDSARANLRRKFKLSQVQAQAILDMPLKRLAALERRKIQDEYKEKQRLIKHLEGLLRSPKKIRDVVRDGLLAIKESYADARRTQILDTGVEARSPRPYIDLAPDEPVWVAASRSGLVARVPDEGAPPRVPSRPQDAPVALLAASTRDTLYLFAANGKAAAFPVHQLPEGAAWEGAGAHCADLTPLTRRDTVVAALALPPSLVGARLPRPDARLPRPYLFLATRQGIVKRVALADLPGVSGETFVVIGVEDGDALGWVAVTTGEDEVMLVTSAGRAIRFQEQEVRSMGLAAGGVMGVKMTGAEDCVVALAIARPRSDLLVVAEDGRAKRAPLSEYPTKGRYGQGVITARFAAPDVGLAGADVVQSGDPVILITEKGAAKTIRARSAPRMGRQAQGKSVIALRGRDIVVDAFTPLSRPEWTTTNKEKKE